MSMHGEYKMPGGKLIVADVEVEGGRFARVQISGDFFLYPDSALDTINQALTGLPGDSSERAMASAIVDALTDEVTMYGISPEAVAVAVARARESAA